jgi:hypothetical protein
MCVFGANSRYQFTEDQLYGALASLDSCLDAVHTSNTVLLRRDSKPTVQSKLCDPDESCSRGGLSVRLATCRSFFVPVLPSSERKFLCLIN